MAKVIVIGGGWAGTAAALAAAKAGAETLLLERTDILLGTGNVGGIMRNNGRYTAAEETIALGAPELFEAADIAARHKSVDFPGHKHALLYDVFKIEPIVKRILLRAGVTVKLQARFTDVEMDGTRIKAVKAGNTDLFGADAFIDATGTAGPTGNCGKYGNGCVMCILRCPSFGGRVSVAAKAGVKEILAKKEDGSVGAMSGSCKLDKDSLSADIVAELDQKGVCVIPIPQKLQKKDSLGKKACQQYALKEFAENLVLLDTGHAKLMSPFYPLELLREIPGFENARYEDPYAGGVGNSIRYLAISPRNDALKVQGVDNLFCAGEKAGPLVGHTEAVVTGTLAGYNAVKHALGQELLILPKELAVGDAIAYVGKEMKTEEGMRLKYTFSGSVYFNRMKELDLYTVNSAKIKTRVAKTGLGDVFNKKLITRGDNFANN